MAERRPDPDREPRRAGGGRLRNRSAYLEAVDLLSRDFT